MSTIKRPRACDACHSIKTRCELGSTGGSPPCQRCVRLGKDCLISPPKRQKDRVAELEAQVEALTRLLQSQNIQPSPANTSSSSQDPEGRAEVQSSGFPSSSGKDMTLAQKKRRIDEDTSNDPFLEVDAVVPQELQRRILKKYVDDITPVFPLVPIVGDTDYDFLRRSRPFLFQAIIYVASPGVIPVEIQEDVPKVILSVFASAAIIDGKKSLDLVQALHVACLWYRAPKNHTHIAVFQLIQLAAGIAEDIGIGGPHFTSSISSTPISDPDAMSATGWRAWLGCHLLSACIGVFMRRPNAQLWTEYDDRTLEMLGYHVHALPTDLLLCQFVRAERLCERVAKQCNLYNFSTTNDVSDTVMQSTMQGLQNEITDWKVQIPSKVSCPSLTFWEYLANLYLHESVLHTTTNKKSFAAPFLSERLSATDFPAPFVTQEHVASLHSIKKSSHALLNLFSAFDTPTLMSLPALLFASRIAYGQYILVKLYVATTGTGNTYGAFLDPSTVEVEEYLRKMIAVANRVREVDERCGPARILATAARLMDWVQNYRTMKNDQDFTLPAIDRNPALADSSTSTSALYGGLQGDWTNFDFSGDSINLDLDETFMDLPFADWFTEPFQNDNSYAPSILT